MIIKIGTVSAGYVVISNVHPTGHTGIDFAVPLKTPLYAPYDGVVSAVRDYGNSSLGKAVFVQKVDGTQYVIGHCSEIKAKIGQIIHHGDLLALSGTTGRSTGPHFHYGEFLANGLPIDPGHITFSAFQHHPIIDWFHTFTVNAINEMITDITINVLANPQFLTILILTFSIYYMVSSLKIVKWFIIAAIIYLIIEVGL